MPLYLTVILGLFAYVQGHNGHSHGLGTAEVVSPPPPSRARSMALYVIGDESPIQEINNSTANNLVGEGHTIKDLLVRVSKHHRKPAGHISRHHDAAEHVESDGKSRKKRCSRCGGYGGGGLNTVPLGGGSYSNSYSSSSSYSIGGGGLGGLGGLGGGCGSGLCGGGVSRPVVYQQPAVVSRPVYGGGGGGGVCSTCGGGGGLNFNRPVYAQPTYTQPIVSQPVYSQPNVCSVCGGSLGTPAYGGGLGGFRSASAKSSAVGYGRK